jgi:dihydroorotate dehydrogenase electron transfer subunit
MKVYGEFEVLSSAPVGADIRDITVLCPDIAGEVRPGQFAGVYANRGELILPRPISVCDAGDGVIRLVFRITGPGTRAISRVKPGGRLRLTAPLGNGFPLRAGGRAAIIGGGIGVPPLLMLAKRAASESVHAFLGFRGKPFLVEDFRKTPAEVVIATDDGLEGFQGTSVEAAKASGVQFDVIYACGPRPMLKAAAEYAAVIGAEAYVSLEERMACGIGACVGCAVKTPSAAGTRYAKVCSDGPVFEAGMVEWD